MDGIKKINQQQRLSNLSLIFKDDTDTSSKDDNEYLIGIDEDFSNEIKEQHDLDIEDDPDILKDEMIQSISEQTDGCCDYIKNEIIEVEVNRLFKYFLEREKIIRRKFSKSKFRIMKMKDEIEDLKVKLNKKDTELSKYKGNYTNNNP